MSTASRRSRTARAGRVQATVTLLIGAGLFIGGAVAVGSSVPAAWQVYRYETAPTCSAMSDAISGADCRASGSALVIGFSDDGSVRLQPIGPRSPEVLARLSSDDYPRYLAGDTVPVELWAGKVTSLAGDSTLDDPTSSSTDATIGVLLGLIGLALIIWGVWTWRRPHDDLDAPSLAPISTGGTLFSQ